MDTIPAKLFQEAADVIACLQYRIIHLSVKLSLFPET